MARTIILVTGAGRSGTSTVAGALTKLGFHLPSPKVEADETNPRGFFESQWVVDFHKRLLNAVPVRTIDSRPEAYDLMVQMARRPEPYDELRAWLAGLHADRVVVKDPRAFWLAGLWRRAAADTGFELASLTMLRHPAEVAASRDFAYLRDRDESFRRQRGTANIAAWCSAAYDTERATRPSRRAFVRHADLMADWRAALTRAGEQLGLDLRVPADHHPVDDFVDTSLRRATATWDAYDLPDELQLLAERTWEAVQRLVPEPTDADAVARLEALRAEYLRLHDFAVAVALDHTHAREAHVRRRVKQKHGIPLDTPAPYQPVPLAGEPAEATGGLARLLRRRR